MNNTREIRDIVSYGQYNEEDFLETDNPSFIYDNKAMLKANPTYAWCEGGRSSRKSFAWKSWLVKCFIDKISLGEDPFEERFIYLRRYDFDIRSKDVAKYFLDLWQNNHGKKKECINYVEKWSHGEFNMIEVVADRIYLSKEWDEVDDKGKTVRQHVQGPVMGFSRDLAGAEHSKSLNFPCGRIIFEEFLTDKSYLENEPSRLQDFVSTVARNRKIFVILVANPVSPFNPYFADWGLVNYNYQRLNTIEIYKFYEQGEKEPIRIAIEKTPGGRSQMAFGHKRSNIVEGGYECREMPKLPGSQEDFDKIHEVIFKIKGYGFGAFLLSHKTTRDLTWFVYPIKDINSKNIAGKRYISDEFSISNLWTNSLTPLTQKEGIAFNLLKVGKVCFANNMCGTLFEQAMSYLKKIK